MKNWILKNIDTSKYKIVNKNKLLLVYLLDKLLSIFPAPKKKFIDQENYNPKNILVVRVAYIGDVILSVQALKSIKKGFPESRLVLLTNPDAAELLKENHDVDEIIPFTPFWFYKNNISKMISEYFIVLKLLRRQNFDLAIDLRGDIRNIFFILFLSGAKYRVSYDVGGAGNMLTDIVPYPGLKHKSEYHLDVARYLKCKTDNLLSITLTDIEIKNASQRIKKKNGTFYIGIHPGARLTLKCYPSDKFAEAINLILKEYGLKLYMFGCDSDMERILEIKNNLDSKAEAEVVDNLSIRELTSFIAKLDLFICNDSTPMHSASAFNIPTIAIFGPSNAVETGPSSEISMVIQIPMECRESCDENSCSNSNYHACMSMIEPKKIAGAFSSLSEFL